MLFFLLPVIEKQDVEKSGAPSVLEAPLCHLRTDKIGDAHSVISKPKPNGTTEMCTVVAI